jgi:hypothetical protein
MSFDDCCVNAVKIMLYKRNKPLIISGLLFKIGGADGTRTEIIIAI